MTLTADTQAAGRGTGRETTPPRLPHVQYFPTPKAALDFQYELGLKPTLYNKVNPGESQMFSNLLREKDIFGVRWMPTRDEQGDQKQA